MTTKCPACGQPIVVSYEAKQLSCPACGWGTGRPASPPERVNKRPRITRRPVRETNAVNVLLLGLAAGAIIALAAWLVFGLAKVEATNENTLFFVGGLVVYAIAGYFLQPAADEEGSEWLFGGCEDEYGGTRSSGGRALEAGLFLFPGRLIALAIVHTLCLIRQAFTGGRTDTGRHGRTDEGP
jgi:ribosomal protein L37E